MDTKVRWQLLPGLAEEEYEALKADIAERGVLIPVEYDEHGDVLDGHHRLRACADLGIKSWPTVTRGGLDDAQKRRHVRAINLARRHLSREAQRDVIASALRDETERSNRLHARDLGVSHETVQSVREKLESIGEIRQCSTRSTADGRQYPSKRSAPDPEPEPERDGEWMDSPPPEPDPEPSPQPISIFAPDVKGQERAGKAIADLGSESSGASLDVNSAARAARKATSGDSGDEWFTPQWIFDALGLVFDIDVCAPSDTTHLAVPAVMHYTIEDDGLAQPWHGTVWCNPPYSDPEPWARAMVAHGDGLLLCHMPMNAGWCVDVWHACNGLRLFQGIEFVRPDGSTQRPGYWLQLAAFGQTAAEALARLEAPAEVAENPRRVPSPMLRVAT